LLGGVEHDLHQRRRAPRQVQAGVAKEEQRGVVFDVEVRAQLRERWKPKAQKRRFGVAKFSWHRAPRVRISNELHTRSGYRSSLPACGKMGYHACESPTVHRGPPNLAGPAA